MPRALGPDCTDGNGSSARIGDRPSGLAQRTQDLLEEAATCGAARRKRILDEVVTTHLWLAESIARRYGNRGEDFEDLVQVAAGGLVEAARRFDPTHTSFVAFAAPTIDGVLKRHFRNHGWMVRPPRKTQELALRLWREWPEIIQAYGMSPSDQEIATRLGADLGDVHEAQVASCCYTGTSIDAAPSYWLGWADSDPEVERRETQIIVYRVLAQLDTEERTMLRLRFCEEQSQSAIAAILGVSQMQVSRQLSKLLVKLRDLIGPLDDCLASGQNQT